MLQGPYKVEVPKWLPFLAQEPPNFLAATEFPQRTFQKKKGAGENIQSPRQPVHEIFRLAKSGHLQSCTHARIQAPLVLSGIGSSASMATGYACVPDR